MGLRTAAVFMELTFEADGLAEYVPAFGVLTNVDKYCVVQYSVN